jgi:hypothetical protein
MIRLEYDVPTAGVRVSFVLKDGESSKPITCAPPSGGRNVGDAKQYPQTLENLEWVAALLRNAMS